MSSNTWTPDAPSFDPIRAYGRCWRVVEAQNQISTTKLTDTAAEQRLLEQLIEETKPNIPEECQNLQFLLYSPFRYPPYPHGSRFRRPGADGIFYASDRIETAIAEKCFYKILFYLDSPDTKFPTNAAEHTAFAVDYKTERAISLLAPPLNLLAERWTDPTNYGPCQQLADAARAANIELIKYASVRDAQHRPNIAILTCRAFAGTDSVAQQTWRLLIDTNGIRALCEMPRQTLEFKRDTFNHDPRLKKMTWDR